MKKCLALAGIVVASLLGGCQSTGSSSSAQVTGRPLRYLAWMEGDVQTDYQPDRTVAEKKLQQWEGKVPDPKDTDTYLDYLAVLSTSGKSDAEAKIKTYLSQNPKEKRAVFLLGVHYLRTNKKELAGHFFNTLEKDSDFAWKSLLYNNLGMLALNEKNRPLAIDYFERAVKASPPTAAPFVNLGALYLQSRSYKDAEQMFAKARDIDREFEDATLGLGAALEGQGKFAEAHKAYQSHIDNNPDALSVVYNDAIVLGNRLKQRDQAAQMMLRYMQRGGKETAKAQEIIQGWR